MNFNYLTLDALSQAQGAQTISMVVMLALMGILWYFFIIRPEKKRKKAEKEMRDNLQVGDEIITIGGIHGRVISLKEQTIVIESISDHSKITIERWALQSNVTVHDETAK